MPMWFDPHTVSFEDDPYPVYRRLRDESPVHRHDDEDGSLWALSRYDDVNASLADWGTFSSVGSMGYHDDGGRSQLITTDPPFHDALRRAARDRFSPKRIAALEERVTQHVATCLDALRAGGRIDVARDFAWPLTLATISEIIGIPEEDRASVLATYQEHTYSEDRERAAQARVRYARYFDELATERLARPRDDFASDVTKAVAAGEVEKEDAVVLCMDLFEGGVDVPANLIANAVHALRDRPEQRASIAESGEDVAGVRLAVEELARYESPIQYIPRIAATDVVLHDAEIPAGAKVLLLLGSANHDEAHFPDPDELDVTRPATRNLAFGAGVHFCIGAPLARLEARLALPVLLGALSDYEVVEPVRRPRGASSMRALLELEVVH